MQEAGRRMQENAGYSDIHIISDQRERGVVTGDGCGDDQGLECVELIPN